MTIDRRVHSRMIGQRGRHVKKIMEDFDVEIRFPRESDPDPNIVVISGEEENVLECKDRLIYLEEEFVSLKRSDRGIKYWLPSHHVQYRPNIVHLNNINQLTARCNKKIGIMG